MYNLEAISWHCHVQGSVWERLGATRLERLVHAFEAGFGRVVQFYGRSRNGHKFRIHQQVVPCLEFGFSVPETSNYRRQKACFSVQEIYVGRRNLRFWQHELRSGTGSFRSWHWKSKFLAPQPKRLGDPPTSLKLLLVLPVNFLFFYTSGWGSKLFH